MALNFTVTTSLQPKPCSNLPPSPFAIPKHRHFFKLHPSSCKTFARSEGIEGGGVTEEESPAGSLSSSRTQLDLLEQLTTTSSSVDGYESDGSSRKLTIRDQLAQLVGDRDDDFSIPLGKNLKKVSAKFLTTSQKRNIRRQAYLNEVTQRNDSVFFATIGAFVILPPLIILAIAVLTGYVQLFP
ncbi:Myosin-G heavy chain-like protein [Melia azedarach]|uniref:Myosin-G heavy chain-like protein n=1 Tax=Melia azedarach TaxID=155640 RepID=A0ACC1Z0M1_MELAZ|nr:Myosin-G heavy chain-like protein [Melia azedarach]